MQYKRLQPAVVTCCAPVGHLLAFFSRTRYSRNIRTTAAAAATAVVVRVQPLVVGRVQPLTTVYLSSPGCLIRPWPKALFVAFCWTVLDPLNSRSGSATAVGELDAARR